MFFSALVMTAFYCHNTHFYFLTSESDPRDFLPHILGNQLELDDDIIVLQWKSNISIRREETSKRRIRKISIRVPHSPPLQYSYYESVNVRKRKYKRDKESDALNLSDRQKSADRQMYFCLKNSMVSDQPDRPSRKNQNGACFSLPWQQQSQSWLCGAAGSTSPTWSAL